ncbi:MAG TPA: ABC transporter permease [Actinomycetota bacterium]|nr:ABC transporter permease [Actinomycetota bacterium]
MNLRRASTVFKRNYYEMKHTPAEVFDLLYWPFFDLLAWGLLASFIESESVELPVPIAYLIGAALLWNVFWRVQNGLSMAFLVETWTNNVIGLMASPMTPTEFIAGSLMWVLTCLAVQTAIMAILAWTVFHFGLLSLGLSLVPFFAALLLFAVAMAFLVLGVILRVGHGANAMAWGLAGVVQPLSAVYYPMEILPGWAQVISSAMPASHVFEAMRAVTAGEPTPWSRLWVAFGLDAVYLIAAMAFCAHMFQTLRRRGYVTRYA